MQAPYLSLKPSYKLCIWVMHIHNLTIHIQAPNNINM